MAALIPTPVSCCFGNEGSDLMGKGESSDKCMLEGGGEREEKLQRLILMSGFEEHFYSSHSSCVSSIAKFSAIFFVFSCCSGHVKQWGYMIDDKSSII